MTGMNQRCERCGRESPDQESSAFLEWEAVGSGESVLCPGCLTGAEETSMVRSFAESVPPDSWAFADERESQALGLPERRGGWGLLMFQADGRHWTWAVDRVLVAALDEHEGDVPAWATHSGLEADGWPEPREHDGRLVSMLWRERT